MIAEMLVPISDSYRKPIFDAVVLQVILGILSLMMLDGGDCAHISGAALLAFWGGTAVLIWRHPRNPTKIDLKWIQFGYLPVLVFAFIVIHLVWVAKGFRL
jgi:hypothetical protein